MNERIETIDYVDNIMFKAFGSNKKPTYQDYLEFIESRCFPRDRDKMKLILKDLNLPFYDPIMIIEKTEGRMAEDDFWIRMERAQMVELFEQNIRTVERQSSKGNQLKWENSGVWYKADFTGYEGLAEYIVSHLLEYSSLGIDEFVTYDFEDIKYKKNLYKGVKSNDFICDDWQIITLERLFKNKYGRSLYQEIWHIKGAEPLIN